VAQLETTFLIELINHDVDELILLSLIYGLAQADLVTEALADAGLYASSEASLARISQVPCF
jgi:hypothetical protein